MKDGTMKACIAALCVIAAYAIYVFGSVAAGEGMPDGAVFGSVIAVTAGILGYSVHFAQTVRQEARKGP